MSQDQNYQDQGSLDQPQQPVEAQPDAQPDANAGNSTQGAYQAPGVVPPEQQEAAPEADVTPQAPGGGAVPTPGEGEVQLPDGSIVPDTEATPARIAEAQNTPAPAQPAPGGGAPAAGGGEAVPE